MCWIRNKLYPLVLWKSNQSNMQIVLVNQISQCVHYCASFSFLLCYSTLIKMLFPNTEGISRRNPSTAINKDLIILMSSMRQTPIIRPTAAYYSFCLSSLLRYDPIDRIVKKVNISTHLISYRFLKYPRIRNNFTASIIMTPMVCAKQWSNRAIDAPYTISSNMPST